MLSKVGLGRTGADSWVLGMGFGAWVGKKAKDKRMHGQDGWGERKSIWQANMELLEHKEGWNKVRPPRLLRVRVRGRRVRAHGLQVAAFVLMKRWGS